MFIPIDDSNRHEPFERGDVVLVPQAVLLSPAELPPGATEDPAAPRLGDMAGVRRLLWDEPADAAHAAWAHVTLGPAVILPPGCAIDKDYTVLRNRYLRKAKTPAEQEAAEQKAAAEADKVLQVAAIRHQADMPAHQRSASSSRIQLASYPEGPAGPFVVDLTRITTVSYELIPLRIGIATAAFRDQLEVALSVHYVARNIDISLQLQQLFAGRTVVQVDSLAPDVGEPGVTRAKFILDDGTSATVAVRYVPEGDGPPTIAKPR